MSSPAGACAWSGVPKMNDNDLDRKVVTFGFDTAVPFATESIDRLHTTAESHRRFMVVEVWADYAGWIALHAGVAASADAILIPGDPVRYGRGHHESARARVQPAGIFRSSWWPRAHKDGGRAVLEEKSAGKVGTGSGGWATRSARSWRS